MKTHLRCLLPLCLITALAVCTAGCINGAARSRAEREIEKLLPSVIGPADSYKVRVEGSASSLMRGLLKSVHITGLNVRAKDLPKMTRMEVAAEKLQIDINARKVLSSGRAQWTGWVDQDELSTLLANKVSYIENPKITITKNCVTASGRAAYHGVGLSGTVNALPSIKNGNEIWMTPKKVGALGFGIGLPGWGQDKIDQFINPVYTVPRSPLKLTLSAISAEARVLKICGTLDPKGLSVAND